VAAATALQPLRDRDGRRVEGRGRSEQGRRQDVPVEEHEVHEADTNCTKTARVTRRRHEKRMGDAVHVSVNTKNRPLYDHFSYVNSLGRTTDMPFASRSRRRPSFRPPFPCGAPYTTREQAADATATGETHRSTFGGRDAPFNEEINGRDTFGTLRASALFNEQQQAGRLFNIWRAGRPPHYYDNSNRRDARSTGIKRGGPPAEKWGVVKKQRIVGRYFLVGLDWYL